VRVATSGQQSTTQLTRKYGRRDMSDVGVKIVTFGSREPAAVNQNRDGRRIVTVVKR
jgi:hypothetical protein